MEFKNKDFNGDTTPVYWPIKNKAEPGQLLSQPAGLPKDASHHRQTGSV